MLITIGLYSYLLVRSCLGLGDVTFPIDDRSIQRIMSICTDYGPEQTEQIYVHEAIHACLHNHKHNYKTKEELDKHLLDMPEQNEELLVGSLGFCLTNALRDKDALEFLGLSKTLGSRTSSGPGIKKKNEAAIKHN